MLHQKKLLLSSGLLMGLTVFLTAGCGSGDTVMEGYVSVGGVRINNGTLHITEGKNKPISYGIGSDGSYKIIKGPTGQLLVNLEGPPKVFQPNIGIKVPETRPPGEAAGGAKSIPIPEKFKDFAHGIKVEVRPNTVNKIDLDFK